MRFVYAFFKSRTIRMKALFGPVRQDRLDLLARVQADLLYKHLNQVRRDSLKTVCAHNCFFWICGDV